MSLADQQWCPTSVQVTVLQARGLRIKGKSGTNDAYALMQLGKEKYQTSVVEKSVAPVWKEEATFDLLPQLQGAGGGGGAERSTLHVHVLHRALVGPDKPLGQAVINLPQLSEDKTRNKTEWFKLLNKTGKPDKDRGEVLVDIQFMRNNMTASMFDLSATGKSRSRLSKFKDKVRGKKKESDSASSMMPSFPQVLTDSEEEEANGEEVCEASRDGKSKKHKMKSLFSPKSNLQRNLSQSMSVLPAKNSSLSGSQSSGLNVDSSEGKKKFKFMIHKRSGSSDSKDSSSGHQKQLPVEPSNLCINGSHIYCEEPPPRTSRTGSSYSLASSGRGSMEDVPENSPPSVDSLKAARQYSPWMEEEEEEEETAKNTLQNVDESKREEEEERVKMEEMKRLEEEEEAVRRQELERLAEEKLRKEERKKLEEKAKKAEEERMKEEKRKREQEERIRRENEKRRQEEEMAEQRRQEERKLAEGKKRKEEEERMKEEKARFEEERKRKEDEKAEEERRRKEEERMRKLEELKRQREEEERLKQEEVKKREEERARKEKEEYERLMEEKRKQDEEKKRIEAEEKLRKEEEEKMRREEEMKRKEEEERKARREEELEEKRRLEEQERKRVAQERLQREEEERIRKEELEKLAKEKLRQKEEERQKAEEERVRREEEEERIRKERLEREEEARRRQQEELEKLAKEKLRREEEERRKAEEERVRREENERIRREEEMRKKEQDALRRQVEERLSKEILRQKEEKNKLEEMKKKEDEQIRRKEEMRQKEEEKAREEKETPEGLAMDEAKKEEERIRREETKEKEAKKSEKEILTREVEECEKKESGTNEGRAAGSESKDITSTYPFDEDSSYNPSEEIPGSSSGPLSHKAKEETVQQRCQSSGSVVGSAAIFGNEKDPVGTQREKRPAPQPPGKNQAGRQRQDQQDVSVIKQIKDKTVKTVSVLPQRSMQIISPLSKAPTDSESSQSVRQNAGTKVTSARQGKRPPPSRPGSVEEPSSESRTTLSHKGVSETKQLACSLNPFEDDEDKNELTAEDDRAVSGPVHWPPVVSQNADKDASCQGKVKSLKMARAPLPPAKNDAASTNLINRKNDGGDFTDAANGARSSGDVQESSNQDLQQTNGKIVAVAGVKEEGPPSARRLQPVKPLNPPEQQAASVVQVESNKSTGILSGDQVKTKADGGLAGPYSQLTREELISLVLKQESQLSERDKKISELEQYIDNLLVRVMEEQPSILMSMISLKKAI